MPGLYSLLFAIAGAIIYAPLVWQALQSVTLTILTAMTCVLIAPLMWCVDYVHDRKKNIIKAQIEEAEAENQNKAAIYILNMKYQEYVERRENICKFIINAMVILLCTGLFIWIM